MIVTDHFVVWLSFLLRLAHNGATLRRGPRFSHTQPYHDANIRPSLNRCALCVVIRVAPDQQCDGAGDCLFVLAQCANTFAMYESPEESGMVI